MSISKYAVVIVLISASIWADWDRRWYDANQWRVSISNYGKFDAPSQAAGFWPGYTNHNYIYGAGIWIGGIVPNGDTVVAVGYMTNNSRSEFAPGLPYSDPNDPQWKIYFSTEGNYPLPVLSFFDSYCCFNEFDTVYHVPDSFHVAEPLGITVYRRTLSWPSSWYDDVIFVEYVIRNDTTYSLNNVYAGMGMDFDIGNEAGVSANDLTGLDLTRKLGFGYQQYNEPTWDWTGKFGLKLLSDHPVAAFKRFILANEPIWDREKYLLLAGYDFETGIYNPYDSLTPTPGDQRFALSVGPFNLQAGDSILLDYVIIGARDTSVYDTTDLKRKADAAQVFYENYQIYGSHDVVVNYPNGGEVLSGNVMLNYNATSSTGNPLQVNVIHSSDAGLSWTTIDSLLANSGTYNWNTANHPDGVLHRIGIFAFDSLTVGCDRSDGIFTIDNPGNAAPLLILLSPSTGDTLSGSYDVTWFAGDPEFGDSLLLDIYFKNQYDTAFITLASNELNDSIYTWNTVPYRNGSGTLIVETHDEEFTVAETVQVCLLNQISGGTMEHIQGLNNIVDLSVLVHDAQQITGHTYELRFLEYRRYDYWPEYIYEIVDSNTGVTVLDSYSLRNGYIGTITGIRIDDYSPIVDGFSIRTLSDGGGTPIICQANFTHDSVRVISGTYPEDSIAFEMTYYYWWAYRGARMQLDWISHSNGGLTLLVTDLDYGDTIPYKPYRRLPPLNPDSAFGWCFYRYPTIPITVPSDTLRFDDTDINLCGQAVRFSRAVPPPQVGDRWIVYPSQYSPPIKGNVYRFTPTGIAEHEDQIAVVGFQIYPVPCTKNLTIAYSFPQRQNVTLTIYDVLGRQVAKLKDGIENPGQYNIIWTGLDDRNREVSAGVYFCRLETEDCRETKKLIMLK
ncbi:MAG: T9SS type A sorting domain-containing protein [candidate division WOR-3 bacterium]|nr:MAG: T9SS type A sorting domain-containing protein [candidate division WOR-3 bacterium]